MRTIDESSEGGTDGQRWLKVTQIPGSERLMCWTRRYGPVAVFLLVGIGSLAVVLWVYEALPQSLAATGHMIDRLSCVVAVGFTVLPLIAWKSDDVGTLVLASAR